MKLLERDDVLAQLQAQWREAAAGPGRLVFVEGEAGIGKTSLLRAFASRLDGRVPLRTGACEAMLAPEPLGVLEDIAQQCPRARLTGLVQAGAERPHLFAAFVDMLAEMPGVVVLEDVHWADQATLDLLRYAGRRIRRTRSLLVASLRSDEVGAAHPLRVILGDLATSGALRLTLAPLSPAAVHTLCLDAGAAVFDSGALHRDTAGNPFFVTEVLAGGAAPGVPRTVQDAVLARAARLSPSARGVLDAAAVAGPRIEPGLLQVLTAAESGSIAECLATGVLRAETGAYTFRHELARQAILQAQTPTQLASLHRMTLQALASDAATCHAAARLAAHADGAGDTQAVRHWAPIAAREATALGAHRQAAMQWERALRHLDAIPERAAALDAHAVELHMSVGLESAMQARRQAARLWQSLGAPERAVASLVELAMLKILSGRVTEATQVLHEAGLQVHAAPDAAAYVQAGAAWLSVHDCDYGQAITLATGSLSAAQLRGDRVTIVLAARALGLSLLATGQEEAGVQRLEQCLALATQAHDDKGVAQGFATLAQACCAALRLDLCESYQQRGIEFCSERDLDAPRLHLMSTRAHLRLLQGRWDDAGSAARQVLDAPQATALARFWALVALARLRARRGEPGVWAALEEALELAATGSVQMHMSCCRARAEAAWLEGRDDDAAREAATALPRAIERHLPSLTADLVLWARRGGLAHPVPEFCATHPAAFEAVAQWQQAAAAWRALGCPFETARALADGDEAAQRDALEAFERLGARSMVERVRHRLRRAGVRGLARGPRASTQSHPAGLTTVEIEVLSQLSAGLRSKEIAARLHRSPRTVDHHLQAIFAKLGVATRAEAVTVALRLGVASAPR
ncbi:MAG: AAA family ATPase [Burkholderiaceae bacterium]|nr:AAA family ATPase [Burkholderiaceae bacterium]